MHAVRALEVSGPTIIDDIGLLTRSASRSLQLGEDIYIVDCRELAMQLDDLLLTTFNKSVWDTTAIIVPGEGGVSARSYSRIHEFCSRWYTIPARRIWVPGARPIIEIGSFSLGGDAMGKEISTVIVLDDVISSGRTIEAVKVQAGHAFPNAVWYAASWISQYKPSYLGYEDILTALTIRKKGVSMAPINSLSTLVDNHQRAKSFAERNLLDPESFLRLINDISSYSNLSSRNVVSYLS